MNKIIFFLFSLSFCFMTKAETIIPLAHSLNGINIIELKFDNASFKFILDTGSNVNFISSEAAAVLEKEKKFVFEADKTQKVSTFNSKVNAQGGSLSLNIFDLSFLNMPTFVMSNKRFSLDKDGFDCCDGILGAPFLSKHTTLINLKDKTLTINPTVEKANSLKNSIPFDIVGNNFIVLSCQSDNTKLKFRLDTGSEVPLIFHSNFVRQNRIFEKIYEKNNMFAPSFVQVKKTKCQELELDLEAYLFTGNEGALTHKQVDANVGATPLGEVYLIDYQKKLIKTENKKNTIDLQGIMGVEVDLYSGFSKADLLQKMEFFILKSCVEKDKTSEECIKKWCELREIPNCTKNQTKSISELLAIYSRLKDDQYCSHLMIEKNYLYDEAVATHPCAWKKYREIRSNSKQYIEFNKNLIPTLISDKLVKTNFTTDQEFFTQALYCYAVKEKIINEKELPLELFSLSSYAISLQLEKYKEYLKWIKTSKAGKECSSKVLAFFDSPTLQSLDLKVFKGHKYANIINLITHLGDGGSQFEERLNQTINHERLHVLYAESKYIQQEIAKKIKALKKEEIDLFTKNHPSYNFNDKKVLNREFFSYTYEKNIEQLIIDFPKIEFKK